MDSLTVTSPLLIPNVSQPLTPAMLTVLWVVADELDEQRVPANVKDAIWLKIPTKRLRPESRTNNVWLRECLTRLTGLQINGEYRGDPWGAVIIAEWHIEEGGSLCRIMIPPAAVHALRMPETFSKIELHAAFCLDGPARRLYAALADKKRMGQQYYKYSLDDLRMIFGVADKSSYRRWGNFKQWVLSPALEQINDFGTVRVQMTPIKTGRSITGVRFDWCWKTIDEARQTVEKNGRLADDRHKEQEHDDAPPLVPTRKERALAYEPGENIVRQVHELAPRQDVYALLSDWKEWIKDQGEIPVMFHESFLAFCRDTARSRKGAALARTD